jgi:predicted transcriptional regulator
VAERQYRGYRVYAYIALTRLFHALDLDLQQPDLEAVVSVRIERPPQRVSKEELLHAIRSNSHMTDKVIDYLLDEKFATVTKDELGYDIRITTKGVDHLRKFHAFYRELYSRELDQHYQYTGPPGWLR